MIVWNRESKTRIRGWLSHAKRECEHLQGKRATNVARQPDIFEGDGEAKMRERERRDFREANQTIRCTVAAK